MSILKTDLTKQQSRDGGMNHKFVFPYGSFCVLHLVSVFIHSYGSKLSLFHLSTNASLLG